MEQLKPQLGWGVWGKLKRGFFKNFPIGSSSSFIERRSQM